MRLEVLTWLGEPLPAVITADGVRAIRRTRDGVPSTGVTLRLPKRPGDYAILSDPLPPASILQVVRDDDEDSPDDAFGLLMELRSMGYGHALVTTEVAHAR